MTWWVIPSAGYSADPRDNLLYALRATSQIVGTLLAVPARSHAVGVGILVGTTAVIVLTFVGYAIAYSHELGEGSKNHPGSAQRVNSR